MYLILLLTLRTFNRLILFIYKWSPHVAISMPYCIFFYFFPFVVTCWIFVILPLTLQSFNHRIFYISKWSPLLAISMPHCFLLYFFRFLVTCWIFVILPLTLWSFNQPIVSVFEWNPHAANSCLITLFVIIYFCFDLLNVSYSASHSSKFQPAYTFHV